MKKIMIPLALLALMFVLSLASCERVEGSGSGLILQLPAHN